VGVEGSNDTDPPVPKQRSRGRKLLFDIDHGRVGKPWFHQRLPFPDPTGECSPLVTRPDREDDGEAALPDGLSTFFRKGGGKEVKPELDTISASLLRFRNRSGMGNGGDQLHERRIERRTLYHPLLLREPASELC
jgi:hypothetical protein